MGRGKGKGEKRLSQLPEGKDRRRVQGTPQHTKKDLLRLNLHHEHKEELPPATGARRPGGKAERECS